MESPFGSLLFRSVSCETTTYSDSHRTNSDDMRRSQDIASFRVRKVAQYPREQSDSPRLSTCDADSMGQGETTMKALHLLQLLKGVLGEGRSCPYIKVDNQEATALCKQPIFLINEGNSYLQCCPL